MVSADEYQRMSRDAMTEEELLQQARSALAQAGWQSWHTRRSERSDPGMPDLFAMHPVRARVALIECKTNSKSKARLSVEQAECLQTAMRTGLIEVYVLRPDKWDVFLASISGPDISARWHWWLEDTGKECDGAVVKPRRSGRRRAA